MPVILLIETSTEVCSVGLCSEGRLIARKEIRDQKSHASSINVFINQVLSEAAMEPAALNAVAVSSGPGSYTGLRIGVSTAKGLCYALGIPLLAIDSLLALTHGFLMANPGITSPDDLLIPMVDARRMEVYAAIFDIHGNRMLQTEAIVLNEQSFSGITTGRLWLFGNGAAKTIQIFEKRPEITVISDFVPSSAHMVPLAHSACLKEEFADLAYFEPFYLKDFVAGVPKIKGLK
ncbi:MAG TPA: tRNA (adenosine(37)-N6)-threonylcarbamoyltransferase complex dimerization subunit type 1 TsaB [Bacteroidales bacterium]|nr:tRNA (adenosine(37)-N6)-threonylcarbamoyltransferase complex dimerization subunit type 1 TsaB [Bacteroidales bacterium]